MFKKKIKEEPRAVDNSAPQYYEDVVIQAAMKCINDALETGQIGYKHSKKGKKMLVVVDSCSYMHDLGDGYMQASYTNQIYPILDQMEIKTLAQIEKEIREEKQKELEKLQTCQARDLAEIERLARELGKK